MKRYYLGLVVPILNPWSQHSGHRDRQTSSTQWIPHWQELHKETLSKLFEKEMVQQRKLYIPVAVRTVLSCPVSMSKFYVLLSMWTVQAPGHFVSPALHLLCSDNVHHPEASLAIRRLLVIEKTPGSSADERMKETAWGVSDREGLYVSQPHLWWSGWKDVRLADWYHLASV